MKRADPNTMAPLPQHNLHPEWIYHAQYGWKINLNQIGMVLFPPYNTGENPTTPPEMDTIQQASTETNLFQYHMELYHDK